MRTIPKLNLVHPAPPILYCGCHEQTGHYFWVPGMQSFPLYKNPNYKQLVEMDGGFCPDDTTQNGQAWFHSTATYSVISFWDNSIDHRPGSHSTFLLVGEPVCFNDAIAKCKAAYPEVFERFKFEIVLRKNCFMVDTNKVA